MYVLNINNNKNQFEIVEKDCVVFQSYASRCAEIKNGILKLGLDWDYSKTTLKHLYAFLDNNYDLINSDTIKNYIIKLKTVANKKQYLQKLIDNNIIKVDINL